MEGMLACPRIQSHPRQPRPYKIVELQEKVKKRRKEYSKLYLPPNKPVRVLIIPV